MNAPSPEWHFLPEDPESFFGLNGEYDRKTLKRAYNALIRYFKPERFPEEFKQIRAAYEELEQALRHGRPVRPPTSDVSPPPQEPPPAPDLNEILKDPEKAYRQLAETASQPIDFYTLAVLSDLVEPEERFMFGKWLITGLNHDPGNEELHRLLVAYAQAELPPEHAARLVTVLAGLIPEGRFFEITEALWSALLLNHDFDAWKQLLAEAETCLKGNNSDQKLIFLISIGRKLFWRADQAFLDEMFAFIDDHFEEIPHELEEELSFLEELLEYHKFHQEFLNNGNTQRLLIHEAIVAWCNQASPSCVDDFVAVQLELSQQGTMLLEAFPTGEDFSPVWTVYAWICHEIHELRNDLPRESDPDTDAVVNTFYKNLEIYTDHTFWGRLWLTSGLLYFILVALFMGVLPGMVILQFAGIIHGFFLLVLWGAWAACFWLKIKAQTIDKLLGLVSLWFGKRCYRHYWRHELYGFLKRTLFPCDQLDTQLEGLDDARHSNKLFLLYSLRHDYGLWFYSEALRFVT